MCCNKKPAARFIGKRSKLIKRRQGQNNPATPSGEPIANPNPVLDKNQEIKLS